MGAMPCNWEGGCRNTTWSPDQRCQVHRGKVYSAHSAGHSTARAFSVPNLPPDPAQSAHRIFDETRRAFPDMGDRVHPQTIREQVIKNLQAGVSVHAYRTMGDTDVSDFEERKKLLGDLLRNTAFLSIPRPTNISDAEAEAISTAVDDRFGVGINESMELSFYGIRKEWELADALGVESDENGVPYGESYDEYVANVKDVFVTESSNHMMRMYKKYPEIIYDLKNRAPLNTTPIFPEQDMTQAFKQGESNKPTQEELDRKARKAAIMEGAQKIDASISKLWDAIREDNKKYHENKAIRQETRAEKSAERRERREYRDAKKLQQLQKDAAYAQIKMEKRMRGKKSWF